MTGAPRFRPAVGITRLICNGPTCLAQLHAEYNRQKDIYLTHRVAQAWELAQFIQCVSLALAGKRDGAPGLRGSHSPTCRVSR